MKEEPKQRLEKYSERFNNKENELVQGIFNPENWGNRVVNEEPKQETLEEVAESFFNKMAKKKGFENWTQIIVQQEWEFIESFPIEFAKWQQQQLKSAIDRLQEKYDENGYDCSLEIKLQRIENHFDSTIKIYQGQNKNLYSEDEIKEMYKSIWIGNSFDFDSELEKNKNFEEDFNQWFNEYKKQ